MAKICVFTATYNRVQTLPVLYESLKRQSFRDFIWVVTDDGSTDGTADLIQSYIDENAIEIRYKWVENAGKSRALNNAANECEEELFLCIDSDDWFTDNAFEVLLRTWEQVEDDATIAGMVALHGNPDGSPVGTRMPEGLKRAPFWDLYAKHHFKGDCFHVYRSEVFKQFPTPDIEGEKHVPESWTFNHISQKYDVALIDEVLTIGEYLPDGLSHNVWQNIKNNPVGYYTSKAFNYTLSDTLYLKFYNSVCYMFGCMLAGKKNAIADAPSRVMAVVAALPAFVLTKTLFK